MFKAKRSEVRRSLSRGLMGGSSHIAAIAGLALVAHSSAITSPALAAKEAVDCAKDVWNNLEACGWVGPKNTGYSKRKLKKTTSGRTITKDGTIIEGEKIIGRLIIDAKDVLIRHSWIIASTGGVSGTGVINVRAGASVTVRRTVLDGSNDTHAGIFNGGDKLVAVKNEIVGVNDGIFIWDTNNFRIKRNYFHGFTTQAANGHVDGFQTEGASHGKIIGNVFDITQDQNSAISIWNSRRDSDDYVIRNNLIAGGGFSVYAEDYDPSEQNPKGGNSVTNIRIIDNKFSTVHYDCVGYWGVWYPRGAPTDGWKRRGNIVLETGVKIDSGNPPRPSGGTCN